MIRVAVAGAAGRMGQAVVVAVTEAEGMEVSGRADPALGVTVPEVLDAADVLVDFTQPTEAVGNAGLACGSGVHTVIGTTGFSHEDLRAAVEGAPGNCFWAPNFAIGAVLMMRFAAEASRHMQAAEIVEYHHPAKLDAPSGTAARTAELMRPHLPDVPIHSVRLPGIVADQEVVLGDVAQTLRITHVTTDRTSFMPGVVLAVRKVGSIERSPLVGLEHLLQ